MIILTAALTLIAVCAALAVGYRWGRTPPRDRIPDWPPHAAPLVHVTLHRRRPGP